MFNTSTEKRFCSQTLPRTLPPAHQSLEPTLNATSTASFLRVCEAKKCS